MHAFVPFALQTLAAALPTVDPLFRTSAAYLSVPLSTADRTYNPFAMRELLKQDHVSGTIDHRCDTKTKLQANPQHVEMLGL